MEYAKITTCVCAAHFSWTHARVYMRVREWEREWEREWVGEWARECVYVHMWERAHHKQILRTTIYFMLLTGFLHLLAALSCTASMSMCMCRCMCRCACACSECLSVCNVRYLISCRGNLPLDGVDQWPALIDPTQTAPRNEMLHQIDTLWKLTALRLVFLLFTTNLYILWK